MTNNDIYKKFIKHVSVLVINNLINLENLKDMLTITKNEILERSEEIIKKMYRREWGEITFNEEIQLECIMIKKALEHCIKNFDKIKGEK